MLFFALAAKSDKVQNSIFIRHSKQFSDLEMAVPPLVSALVAAEAFFLPLGDLLNLPTAILAGRCFPGKNNGRLACRVPVDIIPAAERLYCVHRDANRLGNLAIPVPNNPLFSRSEHYEHEKSYYNINFVNKNRVYKKCVLYTER